MSEIKKKKSGVKSKKKEEVKEEKKKVEYNKKSSKKIIIIGCVVALLLILGIGGYFLYKHNESKKPIKQEWGQTYYMYLKDVKEKDKKKEAGLPEKINDGQINFYEMESLKDPLMVINYKEKDEYYSNVYYIYNNKVNVLVYNNQPTTIELLYNITHKKYDYYSHVKDGDNNRYKSIAEQIRERIAELEKAKNNTENKEQIVEEDTGYNFNSESVDKVVDVNGKEISLDNFDETFIKPEVKDHGVKYDYDLDEKELKKEVSKEADEYKPIKEEITKKVEKDVNKKVEKIENKRKEIDKAKEEVAKKEAEEKAKKEQEERERAEREGFKVGSYTLKYGRYEWDLGELGDYGRKEVYFLRSDKTCSHTDYDGKTTSCTFSVGRATDGQSIESMVERDALIIHDSAGGERSYFPKNGGFRDTDLENFVYKGAN